MVEVRGPNRFSGPDSTVAPVMAVWALFLLLFASVAAWVTHVIVCIKASAWIMLAFGCIVAPVGVIHGVGVWLGVF
jgi:hypothetical protein